MPDEKEGAELYTAKLDRRVRLGTARMTITASSVQGSVEDINTAMQRTADALRHVFPLTEEKR